MPRNLILDVDGSLGSMLALEYALRCTDFNLVAVTTVGGVVDGIATVLA